jgi:hypothetical protein
MDTEINGKPVRLFFDSGASKLILFPTAAQRLGLKVTPPPPPLDVVLAPGEVAGGTTEECTLRVGQTTVRVQFSVMETPSFLPWDEDGVVGWQPLSKNILLIDASAQTLPCLPRVPAEAMAWTKLRVLTNSTVRIEVPHAQGESTILAVDTGSPHGVALPPQKWRLWKAAHSNQPATLEAYFMPAAGLVVKEQRWASQLAIGPLLLTDVPVMEANAAEMGPDAARFEASLGLAALKRLDFIVDGKQGFAYVRTKNTPPCPYLHNRLGAVFVPRDLQADDLAALVVDGSPAYEARIRNGDVLLKIDELDVTKWRTDPAILPLSRFWMRPPGTKFDLALKRGKEMLNVTVVLRQILSPDRSLPASRLTKSDAQE